MLIRQYALVAEGLNEFRVKRLRAEYLNGEVYDWVEAVIDGVSLSELLEALPDDGTSWIHLPFDVVAPPSRHWLGTPAEWFHRGDLVAIEDGGCGDWRCCGPGARIEFTDGTVRWTVPNLTSWEFDRVAYEAEIAGLANKAQELFRPTDLHP